MTQNERDLIEGLVDEAPQRGPRCRRCGAPAPHLDNGLCKACRALRTRKPLKRR